MLDDEEREILRLIALYKSMPSDRPVLVETLYTRSNLDEISTVARNLGLNKTDLGTRVSLFLGKLVATMFEYCAFKALFITGGDTAARTVESLGIKGIELVNEILPGIPLGSFSSDLVDYPIYLVSKAGGFGRPDTLVQVYDFLTVSAGHEV